MSSSFIPPSGGQIALLTNVINFSLVMNQLQQDENTEFKCAKFILEDPTILCTVYTRGCAAGYPSQLTLGERSQEMLTFEAGCINRSAIHQIISYKGGLNGITHLRAHRTYLRECTNFDLSVLPLTSALTPQSGTTPKSESGKSINKISKASQWNFAARVSCGEKNLTC